MLDLPGELIALDPRHGVFPNLVMKPLFATVYGVSRLRPEAVGMLLDDLDDVVQNTSPRRFNVFLPRITDQENEASQQFVVDGSNLVQRVGTFDLLQDLWLAFGHQTCFGLLRWLLVGDGAVAGTRSAIEDFSSEFCNSLVRKAPEYGFPLSPHARPDLSKSARVGLLHRLCTEQGQYAPQAEGLLRDVLRQKKESDRFTTDRLVQLSRSVVPLLHNEAYQDGPHPTGNAQSHFVQLATATEADRDVYWRVIGRAIARRYLSLLGGG